MKNWFKKLLATTWFQVKEEQKTWSMSAKKWQTPIIFLERYTFYKYSIWRNGKLRNYYSLTLK